MSICIIDYGMGNLRSVQKAFEKIGATAKVSSSSHDILDAHALVLPGVGAFKNCFQNLDSLHLINPILRSLASGKPFLGICLGLQILFTESEEFGITKGFDVIKGRVVRFATDRKTDSDPQLKIPHMGWNSVEIKKQTHCLAGIENNAYFYFVHSYYVLPENHDIIATTTSYGVDFVSSICKDNIFACQFHPEKSQARGLALLRNFAEGIR